MQPIIVFPLEVENVGLSMDYLSYIMNIETELTLLIIIQ